MSELILSSRSEIDEHQYLTFYVKSEQFGIGILGIKEIIEFAVITRVPQMSNFMLGITNIRGSVVPVVDLSQRLELGESDILRRTCVVVVETKYEGELFEIGLLVDAVNQVYDIYPSDTEEAPEFGTRIRSEFIEFMGKVGSEFISILRLKSLLNISELSQILR